MKERPIIFSGPMVKAILEGRKTQTRRVVKPQPDTSLWKLTAFKLEKEWRLIPCLGPGHHIEDNMWGLFNKHDKIGAVPYTGRKCPYGIPGDRLWVRETFVDLTQTPVIGSGSEKYKGLKVWYRADNNSDKNMELSSAWKPSIHMPRWASRILLEVVGVRVERVQEVSETDCIAEGIRLKVSGIGLLDHGSAYSQFRDLWDSINAKRGFSWFQDPWVWVVTFKRIEN